MTDVAPAPTVHHLDYDCDPSECSADDNIVGGPREHTTPLLGTLHVLYSNGRCQDAPICAAHLAPTVAFIVNEQSSQTGEWGLHIISVEFDLDNIARILVEAGLPHPLELWRDGFWRVPEPQLEATPARVAPKRVEQDDLWSAC